MSDNTTLNAGTGGDVIATDDIGGVKHQLVKLEYGALDSATPVSPANPLPVDGSGVTQPVTVSALPLPTGAATSANQTNGTQQSKITDGTNTANVLKSDGTAAGQNAVLTAGTYRELSGLSAAALNADLVPSTDVSNTPFVTLSILASAYVGTLTFQGSNDNFTTVHNIPLSRADSSTSGITGATSATSLAFSGYVPFRYFRVRLTAYTSGTAQGVLELRSNATVLGVLANQGGTWTVGANSATGSAVPTNAFMMGVSDGTNLQAVRTGLGDGTSSALVSSGIWNYNGSAYDRQRGNFANIMLASAARTATTASGDFTNWNHRGVRVTFNVTAASGTGGLQVQIQGKDSAISSAYYAINATPTAVIATGVYVYDLYPSAITVQGGITQVTNSILSRVFRVNVLHGDASSYTYSVSYDAIL